jgi:hypothetical protein
MLERYNFADEYLEVCYKLWESSWEDDAVLDDRRQKIYADPAKVHDVHHGQLASTTIPADASS